MCVLAGGCVCVCVWIGWCSGRGSTLWTPRHREALLALWCLCHWHLEKLKPELIPDGRHTLSSGFPFFCFPGGTAAVCFVTGMMVCLGSHDEASVKM